MGDDSTLHRRVGLDINVPSNLQLRVITVAYDPGPPGVYSGAVYPPPPNPPHFGWGVQKTGEGVRYILASPQSGSGTMFG